MIDFGNGTMICCKCKKEGPITTNAMCAYCGTWNYQRGQTHACSSYVPAEDYGSICADCGYGGPEHKSFNVQGGTW